MVCPKCHAECLSVIPAEIRLYRDRSRTLSDSPLALSPHVRVCLDCGWAEFSIPRTKSSARWLQPMLPRFVPSRTAIARSKAGAVSSAKKVGLPEIRRQMMRLDISFKKQMCSERTHYEGTNSWSDLEHRHCSATGVKSKSDYPHVINQS